MWYYGDVEWLQSAVSGGVVDRAVTSGSVALYTDPIVSL